jgi:hypothetical protein
MRVLDEHFGFAEEKARRSVSRIGDGKLVWLDRPPPFLHWLAGFT